MQSEKGRHKKSRNMTAHKKLEWKVITKFISLREVSLKYNVQVKSSIIDKRRMALTNMLLYILRWKVQVNHQKDFKPMTKLPMK